MKKKSFKKSDVFVHTLLYSLIAVFVGFGSAAAADKIWIGGTGNWNVAGNWSGGLPGSGDNVFIDNGNGANSIVYLDTTGNIGTLTLDSGDTLHINNIKQLTVNGGIITNNGEILVNSEGSTTSLLINGATTLTGAGKVTMGPNGTYSVFRATSAHDTSTLTNGSGHTIQGAGQLGQNYFGLINEGLITANLNGGTLSVDLREYASATRINNGTLQAENGGTLYIHSSGIITNNNLIQAFNASNVTLGSNTAIEGGTIHTAGTGIIDLDNGTISNVTNTGTVRVANGNTGYLSGIITNNGEILVNSEGSTTSLLINGATTLTGAGKVTMGPNGTYSVFRATSAVDTNTLTNGSGHTIQGAGQLGQNYFGLINEGLITANLNGGTLSVDLRESASATRINSGTLQAENGGTLYIHSSGIITNSGIIEALDGSNVTLGSATTIQGGTLQTSGTGIIDLINNATLKNLTINGTVRVANNKDGVLAGTITNNGEILIKSEGSTADIRISEAVTIAGTGVLTMGPNATYSRLLGVEGTANTNVLTNSTGHTIQGAGQLGVNYMGLNNQGLITANQSGGTLTMDLLAGSYAYTNSGTLQAENGGTLYIHSSGIITNSGIIEALDGSNVTLGSATTIQGGTLQTSGTGIIDLINNATLKNLTINGTVRVANNKDGVLAGTITNNGEILIKSEGSTADIRISEAVTIAGTGVLTMGPNATYSRLLGVEGTANTNVLTNSTGHTIQGAGQLGVNYMSIVNDGLIWANQAGTLHIDPRAEAGGFTNNGTLQVNAGSAMTINDSLNNFAGNTLTGGTYKVYGTTTNAGIMRLPTTSNITTNAATILLDGPNSNIYNAGTGTNSALTSFATNASTGRFTIENGRNFTTAGAFSNAGAVQVGFMFGDASTFTTTGTFDNTGILQMRGGTFAAGAAGSLSNQSSGEINGYGTISTPVLNHGLVRASGGNLNATIDGQSGTVQIDPGASLTLTGHSDASHLIHNGTTPGSLALGSYNFTVDKDYTNANFGVGNSFNRRANVTGAGQIIGKNAAQAITGDVTGGATPTVSMNLGNVRGGTSKTLNYQVANTGTGADIRGAVQNAANGGNITDGRLSGTGVTAVNFGPIALGNDSGNLGVTFAATSGGALDGQAIAVVSNFDNVTQQTIQITGFASALAAGHATPAGPLQLGNFRVGADGPAQSFAVANTTSGPGAESLGIGSAAATGNFAVTNHLGMGLIVGGGTQADALTASVSNGAAGVNTGALNIQYTTDGTHIDSSFTAIDANSQSIALSATGFNVAAGITSPSPVVIANQRVGDGLSQTLTVSNIAPAGSYTEGLNAAFGTTTGPIINNGGSIALLAGGASDSSSMSVRLSTGSAGLKSGTVTLNYESDGTGTSGLGTLTLGSQTLNVSGGVYQIAQPSLTTSVNLGNVHVGGSAGQSITITNTDVAPGYQEGLDVGIKSTSNATASGSITNLAAGGTSTAIGLGMTAAAAGVNTGSVTLSTASNGTGTSGLSTLALADQTVTTSITGYRLAEANIISAVNFGNVHVGDVVSQALTLSNLAANDGYSENLNASFGGVSDARITTSGSISGLAAGSTNNSSMVVGLNTSAAGTVTGTASVLLQSDGSGTSGLGITNLPSQDVGVSGIITTAYVWRLASAGPHSPEPVNFGNVRIGSLQMQTLSIQNTAPDDGWSEKLNGSIGSASGNISVAGSFNLLAPQATDSTSLSVTLDTASAGAKSGTATISLESDGTGTSDLGIKPLPSQIVNATGNVYRLANPTLETPSVSFVARAGDAAPTAGIGITNTSPDVYTEGLNAGIATSAAGFSAAGNISNLAAQTTDATSLQVGLNTATAGEFSGIATLSLASTGAGTTGEADYSLADQIVSLAGKVYTAAVGLIENSIIDFGIVHVGDTISKALTIANDAAVTALNDVLTGSFSGSAGPFTAGGNLGEGLAAQQADSSSLTASLDTSGAGIFNQQLWVSLQSRNADMADLDLGATAIDIMAQVNNYANPVFRKDSGGGALSVDGLTFTLDFGSILLNSDISTILSVVNDVTGPADLIGGSFTDYTSGFSATGFDLFDAIAAGDAFEGLTVSWFADTLGGFSESIVLNAYGYNASGYSAAFDDITLILKGRVIDDTPSVPEPLTPLLLVIGLAGIGALRKRFTK